MKGDFLSCIFTIHALCEGFQCSFAGSIGADVNETRHADTGTREDHLALSLGFHIRNDGLSKPYRAQKIHIVNAFVGIDRCALHGFECANTSIVDGRSRPSRIA